jgi:hypothetical protein
MLNYGLTVIWKLKEKKTRHFVNWSFKARGHAFSSVGRACNLFLTEKLVIIMANKNSMLNKTCRHQRKHLLVSLCQPPEKKEPPDTTKTFKKKNFKKNHPKLNSNSISYPNSISNFKILNLPALSK